MHITDHFPNTIYGVKFRADITGEWGFSKTCSVADKASFGSQPWRAFAIVNRRHNLVNQHPIYLHEEEIIGGVYGLVWGSNHRFDGSGSDRQSV